jgi:hypothetical protein
MGRAGQPLRPPPVENATSVAPSIGGLHTDRVQPQLEWWHTILNLHVAPNFHCLSGYVTIFKAPARHTHANESNENQLLLTIQLQIIFCC